MENLKLKFDEKGLIPAIVQDHYTKQVLTLAYMNAETLALTIAEGRIAAVEIVENHETQTIAGAALENVPAAIEAENNATVSVVTGATLTSNRIMNTVAQCLEQAAK